MRLGLLAFLLSVICNCLFAQSTIYVRNSTWQDFIVETEQTGTFVMSTSEWFQEDTLVRSWIETTGQEVLKFNRNNAAVPEGDTAYIDINLNGATDSLTIEMRIIGISGGTELDYSVSGNGFDEPWFDDGNFHEVQTTLAGKSVVIKFKPDNDDSAQNRDIRFAIHDLPIYEIDPLDYENPNVMNAMFYNIQMISFGLSGMPQASDRAALFPAQLSPYQDVVMYCEAFDDVPREDHLTPAMEAAGFPYRTEILNAPTGIVPFPVNGGVIIFSRWPIEAEDEIDYSECGQAAQDCLSNKGVKYAKVNKLGKRYHIFGTHMDAGGNEDDIFARRTSMAEMREFIADLDIPDGEPVIFGGDFNLDPVGSDMDYQAFLDTINPIIPRYTGFWESNFNDNFGGIIDHAWMDRGHLVPLEGVNDIITPRSLDPVLWDLSEFSDHRAVLGRFAYPDINQQGGDTIACSGSDLMFSVETNHPVTYQWYKDGVDINGETSDSFELLNAQEAESGVYTCLVEYEVIYGQWEDSLNVLFYPNGADTVEAKLEYEFDVTVDDVLCQLSVSEFEPFEFNVFPNPANDQFRINTEEKYNDATLEVLTAAGKLIYSDQFQTDLIIDVSSWSKGVYVVRIISEKAVGNKQVIVH